MMSTDCTLYPGAWLPAFAQVNTLVNLTSVFPDGAAEVGGS